ncbi:MAG: hypothetical protein V1820_01080 [archaeon]
MEASGLEMKPAIVWPPEFLGALLEILGEPERIEISVFQSEITAEKRAGFVFYPQYTKFVHYRDPKKPISPEGIIETYIEQLAENNPPKFIEKIIWADFLLAAGGQRNLFSAEFLPEKLSIELQYSEEMKKILDRLKDAIGKISGKKPACEVKIVFS